MRLSRLVDRDTILAFIERSGFNPRDAVTWDGLNMIAMTAWENEKLIGAIPLEPRELQIGAGRSVRSVHETVVAVEAAHRNSGLGSRMQCAIFEQRPCNAEIVTVFREEPDSPAYRWYLKNGFLPVMNVQSWFFDQPGKGEEPAQLWRWDDPNVPWELFQNDKPAGRVIRKLQPWLAVHPYRNRYSFWILQGGANSVALLGVGRMHSETVRVDVLELISPDLEETRKLLLAVNQAAATKGWRPVRLPFAFGDPRTDLARSLGYESRWSFDMLARNLSPAVDLATVDTAGWSYGGVDYI